MSTTTKTLTGAALATTAAMLFAMAPVTSVTADEAQIHCMNINSCKGKGACQTANNACNGQNACKGMGWTATATAQECTDKGGTVMK